MSLAYRVRPIKAYEATTSPIVKLVLWAIENPERAVELGTTLIAIGLTLAFIGALFRK